MSKLLKIDFAAKSDSGKTDTFTVSTLLGIPLGRIAWYSSWRRYVFFPAADTIFDVKCLLEITGFIDKQMEARRAPTKLI
jgi:hypothetical protein